MKNKRFYSWTVFVSLFVFIRSSELNAEWVPRVKLPEKLIVGYGNWNQCDDKIIQAAKDGVNTIIWFSIDLLHNYTTGEPYISRGVPDPDCVAQTAHTLKQLKLETIHLISIGGWNSPHPDTTNTAAEFFAEWKKWNHEIIARPKLEFYGYDGIDWDIEGTDEVKSDQNEFKVETLDLIGQLSQLVKRDGYIVTMAPTESYLDPSTPLFDRNLRHTYPEWDRIAPNFTYHGHNTYSYLISRYGTTSVGIGANSLEISVPTFDFVTIQLCEGYSHCLYNTSILKQPASEYIRNIVQQFEQGWIVDFSSDSDISWDTQLVNIPSNRLVIGLANGWADNNKFLLLNSTEVGLGYQHLKDMGQAPKGFAFWNIGDEGHVIPNGEQMWLAKDLNNILQVRNLSSNCELCFICIMTCSLIVLGYNLLKMQIS